MPQIVETDMSNSCKLNGAPEGSFDASELLTIFAMTWKSKLPTCVRLN